MRKDAVSTAREVDNLQKQLQRISDSTFPEAKATRFENGIKKASDKVELLKRKLDELGEKRIPTSGFKDLEADIDKTESKIERLKALAVQKMREIGETAPIDGEMIGEGFYTTKMAANLANLETKLKSLIALKAQYVEEDRRYVDPTTTDQYAKTSEQLVAAEQELRSQTEAYENARANFEAAKNERYAEAATELTRARLEARSLNSSVLEASEAVSRAEGFRRMSKIAGSAFDAIKKSAKSVVSMLGKIGGAVAGVTKRFAAMAAAGVKGIAGIGKHADASSGLIEKFGKRIWGLAKRVFIFSVITKAFRHVRAAFGEGLGYYIAWDKTLGAAVQNLKNQVLILKATFGGAFAPIAQIVVPILSNLVGWLITATNAVGAFIARLTGKSTYKSVVAATAQAGADAAKSVGGATDAVKELKKELAHYDELHVISKDEPSSGSGGGGGTGGGGTTAPGIEYQDTKISDGISDFADKVKEAWRKADFTEIGTILGTRLKEGLDNIPWPKIQDTAKRVGQSFATLINGFVEVKGLGYSIGKTIAEAINTGLSLVSGFINSLHFDSIGRFIRDGINGFLDNIHWEEAYKTAKKFGKGIADLLNNLFDPETFGKIGTAIANGLNTIIMTIGSFLANLDAINIGQSISAMFQSWANGIDMTTLSYVLELAGEEIADLLNNLITPENLTTAGELIGDLVDAVIDGLYALFTEADWLTWGTSLRDGLIALIKEIEWDDVGSVIGAGIRGALDFITGLFKDWKETAKIIKDALKQFFEGLAKEVDFGQVVKFLALAFGTKLALGFVSSIPSRLLSTIGTQLAAKLGLGAITTGGATAGGAAAGGAAAGGSGLALGGFLAGGAIILEKSYETLKEGVRVGKETGKYSKDMSENFEHFEEDARRGHVEPNSANVAPGTVPYYRDFTDTLLGYVRNKNGNSETKELTNAVKLLGKYILPTAEHPGLVSASSYALMDKGARTNAYIFKDEKLGVIAEITGVDKSKLTLKDKEIDEAWASIVKAQQSGAFKPAKVDANAEINEAKDRTKGKTSIDSKANVTDADFRNTPEYKRIIDKVRADVEEARDKTNGETEIKAKGSIWDAVDKIVDPIAVKAKGFLQTAFDATKGDTQVKGKGLLTTAKDGTTGDTVVKGKGNLLSAKDGTKGDTVVKGKGNLLTAKDGTRGDTQVATVANLKSTKDSIKKRNIDQMTADLYKYNLTNGWKNGGWSAISMIADLYKYSLTRGWKNGGWSAIDMVADLYKYNLTRNWKNGGWTAIDMIADFFKWKKGWHSSWNEIDEVAYFYKWNRGWPKSWDFIDMIANFVGNVFSGKKEEGGVFSGDSWKNLPQYAGGGSPTHGTVFAAGENGAEIVGTIGGRTEVLNRSQIAMEIYSAVKSAMSGFGMDIVKQIAYDSSVLSAHIDAVANYIPDVNHITQANRIYAKAEGIDYNRLAQALAAQGGDNNTYVFTAQLDGREIFRETVSQNDLYRTQTGRSAFA